MTYPVGSITGFIRITGAAQAQRDIAGVRASMAGAGESAAAAAAGIRSTEGALAGAGRASSSASAGAAKLRAAQLSSIAATERYNAVLADEDASLARLAAAEATVIRANERLRATTPVAAIAPVAPQAERAAGAMSRFGAGMASAGKMALGLGATLGAFELAKKAIDIGKEASAFQREMLLVQTQAGASAVEVKGFSAAVLGMAGDVATAPEKLATSLYHAYSVGLRGATAMNAVRTAAEGAKVGNADLEQTTNALTAAVASGIPGVQNMAQAMGALNTIVGAGDMNLEQLNEALGSGILVVAKQFGVTLTDVGAALATFGDNNIRGAQAATTLRVSINAMAKPVAGGAEQLAKLGLSSKALAEDMQHGGLNQALHDLKDHLAAAGITGNKVGDVLLTAFGKKAGPGVSVLVDQLSRFDQKTSEIEKGAGSFGDRWKATTQTASFAFQKLGAEIESAGIVLFNKLMPAVTSAANWLGTTLPAAISTLGEILGPVVHMVGTGLAGAWRAVVAVLGPAASALGSIGHFLAQNNGLVKDAATAVLVMWGAWKGVAIATAALSAVNAGLTGLITRAQIAGDRMAMIGRGTATMGMTGFALGLAAAGVAVYEFGKAISSWIEGGRAGVAVMHSLGDAVQSWQAALNAANGALDENVAKSVAAQLQSTGLADKAKAAGISLNELTYGVTHGGKAFDQLVASWKAGGQPSDDTISAAKAMAIVFANTQSKARDLASVNGKLATTNQISATAMEHSATAAHAAASATKAQAQSYHWVVDATGALVQTTGKVSDAANKASTALDAQTAASQRLKQAEDLLNGVSQSLETSTDSFQIALGNLRNKTALATDKNGHFITSLKQTTVAGATNRQMLVGLLDAAKAQAQATADQVGKHHLLGVALAAGNSQLRTNEAAIRSAASAAGLDKDQTNHLIDSLGVVSKIHAKPKVSLDDQTPGPMAKVHSGLSSLNSASARPTVSIYDQASGTINSIRGSLAALNGAVYTSYVDVKQRVLGPPVPIAKGTGPSGMPRGWATVGEQGWEGAYTDDSGRTHIVPHAAAMRILNLPDKIPGYAAGTVPGFATGTPTAKNPLVSQTLYGPMNTGIQGVAQMLKSQIPGAKQAMKDLAAAVNDAFTLKGVQSQLASAKQALAEMAAKVADLRGSVTSALRGEFDPTKYGSVTDLLGGISTATAANKSYAADVAHASKYGLDKTFLRNLEASGNTATLDMLGHASKAQIAQVSKAMVGYRGSVIGAGNVAIAASGYGGQLATDQANVAALVSKQDQLVKKIDGFLVVATQLLGHPTQVSIDGKVIGHTVVRPEVIAVLDELGNLVKYGRHH